jgi:hypothetical protein
MGALGRRNELQRGILAIKKSTGRYRVKTNVVIFSDPHFSPTISRLLLPLFSILVVPRCHLLIVVSCLNALYLRRRSNILSVTTFNKEELCLFDIKNGAIFIVYFATVVRRSLTIRLFLVVLLFL